MRLLTPGADPGRDCFVLRTPIEDSRGQLLPLSLTMSHKL